jgi:hypothetical protein
LASRKGAALPHIRRQSRQNGQFNQIPIVLKPEYYSARNAGNNGDLSAARVATSEAVSPDTNTASSNKPSETWGKLPPRAKNTGAIASKAHRVPVNNPQMSSIKFSANTIRVKCEAL